MFVTRRHFEGGPDLTGTFGHVDFRKRDVMPTERAVPPAGIAAALGHCIDRKDRAIELREYQSDSLESGDVILEAIAADEPAGIGAA